MKAGPGIVALLFSFPSGHVGPKADTTGRLLSSEGLNSMIPLAGQTARGVVGRVGRERKERIDFEGICMERRNQRGKLAEELRMKVGSTSV
jgi:hypothetical protein